MNQMNETNEMTQSQIIVRCEEPSEEREVKRCPKEKRVRHKNSLRFIDPTPFVNADLGKQPKTHNWLADEWWK